MSKEICIVAHVMEQTATEGEIIGQGSLVDCRAAAKAHAQEADRFYHSPWSEGRNGGADHFGPETNRSFRCTAYTIVKASVVTKEWRQRSGQSERWGNWSDANSEDFLEFWDGISQRGKPHIFRRG